MADILQFVPKPKTQRQLTLVDHIDVAFCVWAINMYGIPNDEELREGYGLVGPEDLPTLQLDFVMDCLSDALQAKELSPDVKAIIVRLLANCK